jgi:hypothetical protein
MTISLRTGLSKRNIVFVSKEDVVRNRKEKRCMHDVNHFSQWLCNQKAQEQKYRKRSYQDSTYQEYCLWSRQWQNKRQTRDTKFEGHSSLGFVPKFFLFTIPEITGRLKDDSDETFGMRSLISLLKVRHVPSFSNEVIIYVFLRKIFYSMQNDCKRA